MRRLKRQVNIVTINKKVSGNTDLFFFVEGGRSMNKQMITIIADEDVINELFSYPRNRVMAVTCRHCLDDDIYSNKEALDKYILRCKMDDLKELFDETFFPEEEEER